MGAPGRRAEEPTLYDEIAENKRRSALLVAGFVVFVVLVALAFDVLIGYGLAGVIIGLVVAGGAAFAAYWKSDAVALSMSRARPADPEQYPRLHNIVEGLCIASGLPKPRLYVVEDAAPNAFATGRNPKNAAVAVTTGLLDKMNRVELEAVLAHELSHVQNYDILVSTLAVTMVGIVALLTDVGLRAMWFGGSNRRDQNPIAGVLAVFVLVAAPLVARAMQMTIGRKRESLADTSGVEMTRYPPGLISALEKLRDDQTVVASGSRATAHLWIESPLDRDRGQSRFGRLNRLFDTHPPLDERIAALREL
jgi:heat shock protein HtpX